MATTILYVDDDVARRVVTQKLLSAAGHRVITAENGPDGIAIAASQSIDIAVVDFCMPEMNGDFVASEMKRIKPGLPIVIFSGLLTISELAMAVVDGFVSTSDEPEALLEKVKELVAESQAA